MPSVRTTISNCFLETSAGSLLLFGVAVAFLEFGALFVAAKMEGVLVIPGGVGLLEQYGLYASLIGDAFLLFIAKKYAETLFEIDSSSISLDQQVLQEELDSLTEMLRLQTRHRKILYLFIFIGVASFVSNISFHLFGLSEEHWGSPVFDSPDHTWCFIANKIATLYSWALVLPFCLYVMLVTSLHLHKTISRMVENKAIEYDILNPDRCGGFSFVGSSQVYFNVAAAVVYMQIVLHTAAFGKANFEYIASYIIVTICFVFGNSFYVSSLHKKIEALRTESLNHYKNKIYNDDDLSLEVYKYYHESFFKGLYTQKATLVINATKAVSVCLTLAIKLADTLFKA